MVSGWWFGAIGVPSLLKNGDPNLLLGIGFHVGHQPDSKWVHLKPSQTEVRLGCFQVLIALIQQAQDPT